MTGIGSGLFFFMLALPAPAAAMTVPAEMGLRLRGSRRLQAARRFRLYQVKGQADGKIDSNKIMGSGHKQFPLKFL